MTEEELKKLQAQKAAVEGMAAKRQVEKLLSRRKLKKSYEYEVQWVGGSETTYLSRDMLTELGYEKMCNEIDIKEAAAQV